MARSECPDISTPGEPLLVKFGKTLVTLQVHVKETGKLEHFECTCSVIKVFQNFTKSGSLGVEMSGHSERATQEHLWHTVLVHFEFYWLGTL